MIKYVPIVADGNIFLMSTAAAILGNMEAKDIIHNSTHENIMYRGRGIIIKSILEMIFKNTKDMQKGGLKPTSFTFVWDERIDGKYHKSNIIDTLNDEKSYKGDREYVTEDAILAVDKLIEDATKEEKEELIKKKLEMQKSLIINHERHQARKFLQNHLPKFGIPSYSIGGWEADDLDLMFAIETEKLGGYQIHYSGDSDWSFHLREKDVFWQVNRSKLYRKDTAEVKKKFGIREDLSLMKWAELFYSAKGSHNFLQRTFDPSIKRVTAKHLDKLFSGDFSDISDKDRFETQRKCFRLEEFPGVEKVRDLHKEVINFKITADVNEFKSLLDMLSMAEDRKFYMGRNYVEFVDTIRGNILEQITS